MVDSHETPASTEQTLDPLMQACIQYDRAARVERDPAGNPDPDYFHNSYEAFLKVVRESDIVSRQKQTDVTVDPELGWVAVAQGALRQAARHTNGHRHDQTRLFTLRPNHKVLGLRRQLYRDMRGQYPLGQLVLGQAVEA